MIQKRFCASHFGALMLLVAAWSQMLSAQTPGGLAFDGVNDYVTFGSASSLGVSNFTVECWFNRQGTGATTGTGTSGLTAAVPLVTKGRNENDGSNVDCDFF